MGFNYKYLFIAGFSILANYLVFKMSRALHVGIDAGKTKKKHSISEFPVPRTGGLGIFLACLFAGTIFDINYLTPYLTICLSAIFLIGFYEDIRPHLSSDFRFMLIALFSLMVVSNMDDLLIYNIGMDLPLVLAVPLTVIAFTGIINAVNIVDGMNGLAPGLAATAFLFLGYTAGIHFRPGMCMIALVMAVAVGGFMVFNFPRARLFLGDGGAYLIGFALTLLSVLLVNRSVGGISPWYPVVLLAYPITDTLFSIYRRRLLKGDNMFAADLLHLHSLLYRRVTRKNHLTSVYILLANLPFSILATVFWNRTPVLIAMAACFAALYLFIYSRIVRFQLNKNRSRMLEQELKEILNRNKAYY